MLPLSSRHVLSPGSGQLRAVWSGLFGDSGGKSNCNPCARGRFAPSLGVTTCASCVRGKFASDEASSACSLCALGSFAGDEQRSDCLPCDPGKYADQEGMSACLLCARGKYNGEKEAIECLDCLHGTFSDQLGRVECDRCALGRFANVTGQSECADCPPETYQEQIGQTMCLACGTGRYTQFNTSGNARCSTCTAGDYLTRLGCLSCPDGARCENGRATSNAGFALVFDPVTGVASSHQCPPGICLANECGPNRKPPEKTFCAVNAKRATGLRVVTAWCVRPQTILQWCSLPSFRGSWSCCLTGRRGRLLSTMPTFRFWPTMCN